MVAHCLPFLSNPSASGTTPVWHSEPPRLLIFLMCVYLCMHPCTYTSQVQCFVGLRPDHLHSISCPGGSATASGKQFENQCLHLSRVGLILLLSTTLCLFLLAFFLLSLYMEASNRTPGTKHVLDLTFLLILSPSYFQNR